MNISAGLGVAVREFPLKSGQAVYLLYADCKAQDSKRCKVKASKGDVPPLEDARLWTA
jgi:hypothetical protein